LVSLVPDGDWYWDPYAEQPGLVALEKQRPMVMTMPPLHPLDAAAAAAAATIVGAKF
jgi:hypothetical protein